MSAKVKRDIAGLAALAVVTIYFCMVKAIRSYRKSCLSSAGRHYGFVIVTVVFIMNKSNGLILWA